MLAVGRLVLDNFPHIKAFWIMVGLKLAQVSLAFGVDDLDGTVVEERITHAAGATTAQAITRDELVRIIRAAGRMPVERDTLYTVVRRYDGGTARVSGVAPSSRRRAAGSPSLRVGRISFLNCFPLYYTSTRSWRRAAMRPRSSTGHADGAQPPAGRRRDRRGAPSSIEFARHAEQLALLPAHLDQLAAAPSTRSCCFAQACRAERLRSVALTEKSATSVTLLKVLLPRVGHRRPVRAAPRAAGRQPGALRRALLIGDEALKVLGAGSYPHHYDLGEEWSAVTGLPMVYAVLGGAPRVRRSSRARGGGGRGGGARWPRSDAAPPGRDDTAAAAALRSDFSQSISCTLLRPAQVRLRGRATARPAASSTGARPPSASSAPCPTSRSRRWRRAGAPRAAAERLTDAEALELLERGDLLELGARGRRRAPPPPPRREVTFIVDRNINYTNVCVSGCRFCAFYRKPGSGEGYVLARRRSTRKIEETLDAGRHRDPDAGRPATPTSTSSGTRSCCAGIKERYPIHIHSLSPPEVVHIARQSDLTIAETLDAPAGGRARLAARRRRRDPGRPRARRDQPAQDHDRRVAGGDARGARARHADHGDDDVRPLETLAERVEHLRRIRDLQDETGGFTAFIPWTFQAGNTAARRAGHVPATGADYLRMLAVSRLYLDNFPNIQASWVTQGLKIGQVALAFGANDMGSTMIEENVVRAAGVSHTITVEEMVRLIRAAGKVPVQRDTLYREVRRW